jgi:hypothetical protein
VRKYLGRLLRCVPPGVVVLQGGERWPPSVDGPSELRLASDIYYCFAELRLERGSRDECFGDQPS